MNRDSYYQEIEKSIEEILNEDKFNNYKKQLFAWKLKADFNRTYEEKYIWNKILYLSSNSCKLLRYDSNNKVALKALKESAEVYEYFYKVSEEYDRKYSAILSALCYDIAGYQANALCMVKEVEDYKYKSKEKNYDIAKDNYILFNVKQILLKKLPLAYSSIDKAPNNKNEELGFKIFKKGIFDFYRNALFGEKNNFLASIKKAYQYYLGESNIYITHLLALLIIRLKKYKERSIWLTLRKENKSTSDIWEKYIKLLTTDLYDTFKIKDYNKRISIFEFWLSQLEAIEEGIISKDENFVIQMPTSTGKTFIAELTILNSLIKNPDKKCVYIAPFRALTNEIENNISKNLSKLGYSVSTLTGSYEIDEHQNFILNETDVLVATPEKIDLLFRLQPEFFEEVSLITVDEGHIIGNKDERSNLLEFLLIRLKMKIENLKILFISAVMPERNAKEISQWISSKKGNVISSPKYIDNQIWEPTRKTIGKFKWYGRDGHINYPKVSLSTDESTEENEPFIHGIIREKKFQFINPDTNRRNRRTFPDNENKSETAAMLAYKLSKKGNCLIFCAQVRYTKSVGKSFLKLFNLYEKTNNEIQDQFKENENLDSLFLAKKWFGKDEIITKCIKKGIGIHYGNMPQPLRKAIEKDFREGKLQVLISTNTLGQGLNLPIKNLIIHSVEINPRRNNYKAISVNDFWNVVGRAGRAGKETEGHVIYLSFDDKDDKLFKKYTNINNLDNIESTLYALLRALVTYRIGEKTFQKWLETFSEPHILNILLEEIIGTEEEKLIEQIIDNSLFKVQSLEIDTEPMKKGLKKVFAKINEEVSDPELIKTFAKTGFCLKSNKKVHKYIIDNLNELSNIIDEKDHFALLRKILTFFRENKIKELELKSKLEDFYCIENEKTFNFIYKWIKGEKIEKIKKLWIELANDNLKGKMNNFISDALYYKYPWGVTAFLIILSEKLEMDYDELPSDIENLPTFIKSGLNDELACIASSFGIQNRETAIKLIQNYNGPTNYNSFVSWLANIMLEDISNWNLSEFDKENILEVAMKLNTNKRNNVQQKSLEFYVKGIFYDSKRRNASKKVEVGDELIYEREPENEYDPFAIALYFKNEMIGYVPREYSKLLATEIDLNDQKYNIKVIKKEDNGDFYKVKVLLYVL